MNDSYKELLVKKGTGMKDRVFRIVCLVPTILLVLLTFLTANMILFILAVALGVLDYFIFQWTDVEFEYLYLDKEISIDKVMAKSRRKRAAVLNVEKMEILAPIQSHQLDSYRNRNVKTVDYSAGTDLPGQKVYAMYYEGNQKYLLNLDDDFAKTVKMVAPRKVYMD